MAFSPGDYSDWSLRGEGGEAEIYRARQVSLDRLVAVKRLKLTSIGDADDITRFEREAKLCASLIHPNLLPIFDYGSEGKFYYLVMEFVHGVDLGKIADLAGHSSRNTNSNGNAKHSVLSEASGEDRDLFRADKSPFRGRAALADRSALPESLKVHLARQMVEVVDFIEQKGILHRDLKPENFMADSAARIKLLDLGMALVASQVQTDPKREVLKGTLAYIPPEILRGQGHLGKVSEHYSLALVILELFQGARYYRGKTKEEIVDLIQSGINWDDMDLVPASVKVFLSPYLNPNPAKRPKTLDAMIRGLKALQGNTLAINGGREAMNSVIHSEHRSWLWAMIHASEAQGRIEEAFARLKELLETDPDDLEVQAKFQELSGRLNELPDPRLTSISQSPPTFQGQVSAPPSGADKIKPKQTLWFSAWVTVGLMALVALVFAGRFYFQKQPQVKDMGLDLMERELNQLSKEDEAAAKPVSETTLVGSRKPTLQPFGVLLVTGLPQNYRVRVNGEEHPGGDEIHLPVSRYLLEIQDENRLSIIQDSVTVGGGEPTVFDFQRRAGKR